MVNQDPPQPEPFGRPRMYPGQSIPPVYPPSQQQSQEQQIPSQPVQPASEQTPPTQTGIGQTPPPPQTPGYPQVPSGPTLLPSKPASKMSVAAALFSGLVIGALLVSSMWFYQNSNSYTYKVQRNTSKVAAPRDVQEILSHIEPATVALTVKGETARTSSAGTGFIYEADGVIVTNNHVVQNAQGNINVTLFDGRTLPATVLGRDPLEDLAVLKVEAKNLPTAKLGDSSKITVGDGVIAIGNALALDGGLSVTQGIVSGLNRTIDTELNTQLEGIIQTDAAINRGNSGGPLVNSSGEVIGINTAIADPSLATNVGFAISINRAKPIIEDLKQGVDRKIAFIGITAQDVTERIARELDLAVNEGALIIEIADGSPAAKADFELEDVIIKIDGEEIATSNDMVSAIRAKRPGQQVEVVINRKGQEKTVKVTLGERTN